MSTNVLPFPQPAPIGRIPEESASPVTPTPTVTDSPYTPLELPKVEPRQVPVPEQNPEPQPLGAVSHAGAIAYLADKVLRGAVQGYDAAQQHKADQYNKKLAAQQAIYNDQAKQLHDMAAAGVDPNSDEFKQARNRVLTAWQATMQTIGERIPQPKKSSKSKQGQADGTDQSTLLAQAVDHTNPQDALQATYQIASKTGPPVFHQIAPYLTPQYQAQKRQGAQTAATQASTAGVAATAGLDTETAKARLAALIAKPNQTDDDKAEIDKLKEQLSPVPKFPANGVPRYRTVDGVEHQYSVDAEGNEIPGTDHVRSTAASVPKPLQYDPKTDQVVDVKSGKRWSVGDKGMPVEVASVFKGANSATFDKQQRALQLIAAHTNAALSSHVVQVDDPNDPGKTIYMPASKAVESGASGTGSAEHKGAVNEQAGLVKQELDAKKDFSNASTNLSMMLKTAGAAKAGDGSAQVGILANYLKTVVGGQGTGLRITKAEWDAAAKTRPWLTGIQATFSPAGIMTGAAIAPSQVDQMIQEVHQKTKALHETYQSAQQAAHAPKAAAPVTTPQTHIFDSKAWAAANPKGDVEAAKAQAKAQGYEVQ